MRFSRFRVWQDRIWSSLEYDEGEGRADVDRIDRELVALLQQDATQAYAALGKTVGLSAGAAHERVRKLRERGVIRRTTVDVDPAALGQGVLAFVMVDSSAWMGDSAAAFAAVPEIQEAHVIAGSASVLVKVRTATTEQLQDVLRRLYAIEGVSGTQATVVLETFFERPPTPLA
jgi:DNA-binding Lrp family transcriptional regulator